MGLKRISTRRKQSVDHGDWCAVVLPSSKREFWVLLYFQNHICVLHSPSRPDLARKPSTEAISFSTFWARGISCLLPLHACITKYPSLQVLNFVWLRKEQNQCLHSSETSLITWLLCKNMWGFKKIFTIITVFLPFRSLNPQTIFGCNEQIRDWYFPSELFLKNLSLLCLIERVLKLNQHAMHSISVGKVSHVCLFEGLEPQRILYRVK